MITDGIMHSITMILDNCTNDQQRVGITAIADMLEEYDEYAWDAMTEDERSEWIEQFVMCRA